MRKTVGFHETRPFSTYHKRLRCTFVQRCSRLARNKILLKCIFFTQINIHCISCNIYHYHIIFTSQFLLNYTWFLMKYQGLKHGRVNTRITLLLNSVIKSIYSIKFVVTLCIFRVTKKGLCPAWKNLAHAMHLRNVLPLNHLIHPPAINGYIIHTHWALRWKVQVSRGSLYLQADFAILNKYK